MVTGLAFYVALPAFTKVLSAWPKLFHLSFAWLAIMLAAEVASFVCAMTLLRLLLRTKQWFTVVAALLVGNAVTNVLPAGDVAGAGVQFQMLAIGGINADAAAGGLAAASIIGLAGLFLLPVCVLPAILGGLPVSPGLEHAAYLGIAGFVLIVAFGATLLTTNGLLTWLARITQRMVNALPRRKKKKTEDLPERLIAERNLVRANLGRRWREAVLLIGGRIGFDYCALLCALRATGANPNAPLVLLAYAATAVIALVPLTPGGLGVVEASLSGLLVLAGVGSASAIIATLAYRLVTYWLPIFAGGGVYVAFRHRFGPVKFGASARPAA
ncbi:MAG: lysylphosphatidylglycerol synthase transmembrane domain-containing protein [Acidimicrobiales bacterium]